MKVYYIDLILYFDYSVTLNKLGMGQSIISYLKKQIANINTKITAANLVCIHNAILVLKKLYHKSIMQIHIVSLLDFFCFKENQRKEIGDV
jgi:hypothetical protein